MTVFATRVFASRVTEPLGGLAPGALAPWRRVYAAISGIDGAESGASITRSKKELLAMSLPIRRLAARASSGRQLVARILIKVGIAASGASFALCHAQSEAPTSTLADFNGPNNLSTARAVTEVMTYIHANSWTRVTFGELYGLCTKSALPEPVNHALDDRSVFTREVAAFLQANLPDDRQALDVWSAACVDRTLKNLSPRSQLYSKSEFEARFQTPRRQFSGIGVSIARRGGLLKIMEIAEGSSAEKAGMRVGDILVSVDGVITEHASAEDVRPLFRRINENESSVRWKWRAATDGSTYDQVIDRAPLAPSPGVSVIPMADHTYIRIAWFDDSAQKQLLGGLRKLNSPLPDHVVLDLRGNRGGLFDVAAWIAAVFTQAGSSGPKKWYPTLYRTESTGDLRAIDDYLKHRSVEQADVPTMQELANWRRHRKWTVLIDRATASGAVWVAEVMRISAQARLIGTVSDPTPLGIDVTKVVDASSTLYAVQLEIGKMTLPADRPIPNGALSPDIAFSLPDNALRIAPKTSDIWRQDPFFDVATRIK